jgi:hypothetical protein
LVDALIGLRAIKNGDKIITQNVSDFPRMFFSTTDITSLAPPPLRGEQLVYLLEPISEAWELLSEDFDGAALSEEMSPEIAAASSDQPEGDTPPS